MVVETDTGDAELAYGAPTGLLIADSPEQTASGLGCLAASGIRALTPVGFTQALKALCGTDEFDLVVIEAQGVSPELLDPVLTQVAVALDERGVGAVVFITEAQIDLVAGHLLGTRTQLLCEPRAADRIRAIEAATRVGAKLEDRRKSGTDRIEQLIAQTARIAEELREITVSQGGGHDVASSTDIRSAEIRAVIRARRLRGEIFAPDLFADPAWDMLLDLFAAQLEERLVSVSSLCVAAAVPATTALRWISLMEERGLLQRTADPDDHRRKYLSLTGLAFTHMQQYVDEVRRIGLPIA